MFSLPLALKVGFVAIIFIIALWVSLRRAQNLQSRLSAALAAAVTAGVLAVAVYQLASHERKQARLQASLSSDHFELSEGSVSDVKVVNAARGLVIFAVNGERFRFPDRYPAACWPKPGEMARVRFIRGDDKSSFMHVGSSVLTIEMMRGCSAPP